MILNISRDHLDRYEDFSDYSNSKMGLFKNMNHDDLIIYNHDDSILCDEIEKIDKVFMSYSLDKKFSRFHLDNREIKLKEFFSNYDNPHKYTFSYENLDLGDIIIKKNDTTICCVNFGDKEE